MQKKFFFLTTFFLLVVFFFFGNYCLAINPLDITIIEIGAYKTNGYEYIKIFNNTNSEIDLTDWKFVEGFSDSKPNGIKHSLKEYNSDFLLAPKTEAVICQDAIKFSQDNNFQGLILDSSWGSLNESGEKLQLLDNQGNIIEDFTYIPAKENALKRINFTLPDYSSANWQEKTTEKEKSSSPPPSTNNSENNSSENYVDNNTYKVIINEILPNPQGVDNKKEFIELKNIGNTTINLKNWTINDNSQRVYTIKEKYYNQTFIRPNQFFVIYRNKSKIALNNYFGDEVKLYNQKKELVDNISYQKDAPEGLSYAKNKNNLWAWTSTPTPNKKNIIPVKNEKPIGNIYAPKKGKTNQKIYFDASDSYDPDGDDLFFIWDFGDGSSSTLIDPTHIYQNPGQYKISLLTFDTRDASDTKNFLIDISGEKKAAVLPKTFPKILISEIFPNPSGRDDKEFIELFNPNLFPINLSGWIIKDSSKKGRWKIPQQTNIETQSYIVFEKKETKINLNNTSDSVYLLNPQEKITDKISYTKAKEGMSYNANQKGQWFWSPKITPWEDNYFIPSSTSNHSLKSTEKFIDPIVNLTKVKNINPGKKVEVIGTVVAPPNILGKQFFYLNGLQIYMYNKNFPDIALGSKIKIIGKTAKNNGEVRIKVKNKTDIKILGKNNPPQAQKFFIKDLGDDLVGTLVKIKGEITERQGNTFWLDDETKELPIYLTKYTGIETKKIKIGATTEVVGILSKTKSGYRLLPRYPEDIQQEKVLGTKIENPESPQSPIIPTSLNKYLLATLVAGVLALIIIFLKKKKIIK